MNYIELIEAVLLHIEQNLSEELSLDQLSKQFHLSKFYLNRLFSAVMGTSLSAYVLMRRLNMSLKLMFDSDYHIYVPIKPLPEITISSVTTK